MAASDTPDTANKAETAEKSLEKARNKVLPPEPPEPCEECSKIVVELQKQNTSLRIDNGYLRGAMLAQDQREEIAGKLCGVPYSVHGCDWPNAAAEKIIDLQAEVADLRSKLTV